MSFLSLAPVAPLIMHNGQQRSVNKFAKQLKEVSGIRKKTDEHTRRWLALSGMRPLLEQRWRAGASGHVIESALQEGAKKQKLGKAFKSAVFIDDDAVLDIGVKKKPPTSGETTASATLAEVKVGRRASCGLGRFPRMESPNRRHVRR